MTLKLEVGKTYLDRSGNKVKIVKHYPDAAYYHFGATDGKIWTDGGKYYDDDTDDLDLISEYVEEPKLQLEVSKSYIDGHGVIVTIVGLFGGGVYRFKGSNGCGYYSDGRWSHSEYVQQYNLIAPAPSN